MTKTHTTLSVLLVLLLGACAGPTSSSSRIADEKREIEARYSSQERLVEAEKQASVLFADVRRERNEKPPGSNFQPPRLKRRTPPAYPVELRRQGVQGVVWMAYVVGRDGRVDRVEAVGDSSREFIELAKAAILRWEFSPATADGKPVQCLLVQPLMFTLD